MSWTLTWNEHIWGWLVAMRIRLCLNVYCSARHFEFPKCSPKPFDSLVIYYVFVKRIKQRRRRANKMTKCVHVWNEIKYRTRWIFRMRYIRPRNQWTLAMADNLNWHWTDKKKAVNFQTHLNASNSLCAMDALRNIGAGSAREHGTLQSIQ